MKVFPHLSLKNAIFTPVFEKGIRGSKDNYRPVSVLSIVSIIFLKLLSKQIVMSMGEFLSKYQGGFRKEYSGQHCLLVMLEN